MRIGLPFGFLGILLLLTHAAAAQVPPGYPPDTLDIFPRLKAARALGQTAPDSAAREMRALVALSRQAHLPRWESRIRYRLGDLFVRGQQQAEASAEAFEVLRLARRPADPDPAAEMLGLVLLGDVYFAKGDYATAVRYHRQAYELALRVGTPKEQGRMGASLGNSLSSQKQGKELMESVVLLRKSTELLLAAGDTITAVSCLSAEADALLQIGQLASAETAIREALRYYDYPILRADVMARSGARINLARILIRREQAAEALAITQEELRTARAIKSPMLAQAAMAVMADAASKLGDAALAFKTERDLRLLSDSINSDAVGEQIAALSARYDAERREARIHDLMQKRRIERLAAERVKVRARWLTAAVIALALALTFFGWLYLALRRSRTKLAVSEAAARQLNATQSRLLSVIGHDTRAPLMTVEVVSQLIEQQAAAPDPAELRSIALEMRETTTSVRSLLDNLLYWAHGQTGQLVNNPQPVRPATVLAEVARLYAPVAATKGVALHTSTEDIPTVWADPNLLQTVLRNLVANAIKFTPANGQVTLSATPTPNGVAFRVTDTGQGLSADRLAQLLAQSSEAEKTTSTPGTSGEQGTGLGLAVCRQFAALLGNGLTGESALGKGSTFGLVVPVRA